MYGHFTRVQFEGVKWGGNEERSWGNISMVESHRVVFPANEPLSHVFVVVRTAACRNFGMLDKLTIVSREFSNARRSKEPIEEYVSLQ